ncbi:MAG: hypothetical protein K2M65_07980, partial [Muribaculaceae bacterium]|nr:hypothetical protein [Muribaculaceae bacterium]
MSRLRYIVSSAMMFAMCSASAFTLAEAKLLYNEGDYEQALPTLQSALKAKPADASLNRLVGLC